MYYVGINIAKLNHFASVVSADGEALIKPFKFTNDNDGFCTLLSALASYERVGLIIDLESTAHYTDNLVEFLASKRCQVCVINPILTSNTVCGADRVIGQADQRRRIRDDRDHAWTRLYYHDHSRN